MKKYFTYSNLIATLALFFALSGTAMAAVIITKPNQISKDVIRGSHIKNGTIQATDIALKARQSLKGEKGEQGPQGPQGIAGPQGSSGLSTVYHKEAAATIGPVSDNLTVISLTNLPAGSYIISAHVVASTSTETEVTCRLNNAGSPIGNTTAKDFVALNKSASLSLQVPVNLGGNNNTISYFCYPTKASFSVSGSSITATRVDSVLSQ